MNYGDAERTFRVDFYFILVVVTVDKWRGKIGHNPAMARLNGRCLR
jgi:hypothetical protein